jgi:prepilin-type N-terminal cleavage/methylation domain-containing protein
MNDFRFSIFDCGLGRAAAPSLLPTAHCLLPRRRRRAFTLTELLLTITILALLSSIGFSAYTGAINLAREERTRTMIDKIDTFIMERYEGYRTRAVPIKIPAGTPPRTAAMARLIALRDLMRMELPDRKTDIINGPCDYNPLPGTATGADLRMPPAALWNAYHRRGARTVVGGPSNWPAGWTVEHQGSECLYLILSTIRDGDKAALDYFLEEELGDLDGDGMKEILDAWGTPISFIRWPAGYAPEGLDAQPGAAGIDDDANGTVDDASEMGWQGTDDTLLRTMQTKNYLLAPDPFDPLKVHAGIAPASPTTTLFGTAFSPGYLLHPLIVSAGRDRQHDLVFDGDPANGPYTYSLFSTTNNYPNPYAIVTALIAGAQRDVPLGTVADVDGDGNFGFADNITNHDQTTQ